MSDQLVRQATIYTTHNRHNIRTCLPATGFESAIPEIKLLQAYAVDGTAIEMGSLYIIHS